MKKNSQTMNSLFTQLQRSAANPGYRAASHAPAMQGRNASRRNFLFTLAGTALLSGLPSLARSHGVVGQVRPPLVLPAVTVIRHDGVKVSLQSILAGKTTALQLMFTGCSQSCPLQGALFSAVQSRLPAQLRSDVQLVSLSINPLGDDAAALAAWLRQFGANQHWIAAVPGIKDLDRLRAAMQESKDGLDNHTGQIFFFNRKGLLVWRTENLPPVDVVVRQLEGISRA